MKAGSWEQRKELMNITIIVNLINAIWQFQKRLAREKGDIGFQSIRKEARPWGYQVMPIADLLTRHACIEG
ncbi:hypothetical protein A6U92_23685 [Agrobacterium rubi]|nr:hypothetical protein A6U92_23685 [Agrobacterium rubi]